MSVKSGVAGVLLCAPAALTFLENVGYPAPIEGHSMRVGGTRDASTSHFCCLFPNPADLEPAPRGCS